MALKAAKLKLRETQARVKGRMSQQLQRPGIEVNIVTQHIRLLPRTPASTWMLRGVLSAPLLIQLPIKDLEKEQRMTQVLNCTHKRDPDEALVPGLGLAPSWAIPVI